MKAIRIVIFALFVFFSHSLFAQPDRVYTSLKEINDPSQVYKLKLNYKRLHQIPPQVFTFTNLTELDLSKNFIDSIPPQIARLQNLERFNICRNRLHSVPDSIGFLPNLKYLNLGRNPILDLPESMGQLAELEELVLYLTGVISVPATFFTLNYSLKLLDMRACPLDYDQQVAIEEILPRPRKRWDHVCNCK